MQKRTVCLTFKLNPELNVNLLSKGMERTWPLLALLFTRFNTFPTLSKRRDSNRQLVISFGQG